MHGELYREARVKRHAVYFLLFIVPPLAIVLAWLGLETLSTNRLGWALLLTGIVCSVGIIIAAIIRRRVFFNARAQGSVVQEEPGDRSLRVMTVGMMPYFTYRRWSTSICQHDCTGTKRWK